jgi:hypothetical protein
VRVAVVLGADRGARPAVEVAVGDRGQLGNVLVEEVRQRVEIGVPVVLGLLGDVTELVAQLVEQRHVLHRPLVLAGDGAGGRP